MNWRLSPPTESKVESLIKPEGALSKSEALDGEFGALVRTASFTISMFLRMSASLPPARLRVRIFTTKYFRFIMNSLTVTSFPPI
jgi:hypothetical protein